MIPDKTLQFQGGHCSDGKMYKARITILVAANMTESHKEKLLLIADDDDEDDYPLAQLACALRTPFSRREIEEFIEVDNSAAECTSTKLTF
ncbi:hypothetical protein PR048_009536 [Dryococelus australis]|uniref:Uncharacterized protein n=1 Tax=Dryococelus australis TaxID=614101 RepID=A0ABQ9I050_9NEOP|nr:hypothetical protein PR048_009536 [Dryococelus australis]